MVFGARPAPCALPSEGRPALLLCWTALDRLVELAARDLLPEPYGTRFAGVRERIRRELEERAWNPELQSYVARLDDDGDASTLLIPWYGFEPAASDRMRATVRCLRRRLGADRGLLYRYRGVDSPGEGAFGICSFWGAE